MAKISHCFDKYRQRVNIVKKIEWAYWLFFKLFNNFLKLVDIGFEFYKLEGGPYVIGG